MAYRELDDTTPTASQGFSLAKVAEDLCHIADGDTLRVSCGEDERTSGYIVSCEGGEIGIDTLQGPFLGKILDVAVEFYAGTGKIGETYIGKFCITIPKCEWDQIWEQRPAAIVFIDLNA